MALSIVWAALLGACLGLDRNLRDLSVGWAPCAFWATLSAIIGVELQLSGHVDGMWFWPVTFAACAVAIAKYLTVTVRVGGWRESSELFRNRNRLTNCHMPVGPYGNHTSKPSQTFGCWALA